MEGSYELAKWKIVEDRQRYSSVAMLDGDLTTPHHNIPSCECHNESCIVKIKYIFSI
jgi:hypothetical protein